METGNKTSAETTHRDADADLSLFLYKSGRSVKQFLLWIGRSIGRLGDLLLLLLLFLIRNILWLLIGLVLGLSYGFYKLSKGSTYNSEMVVQANFNSSRELFSTVDYFNALISSHQVKDLSKIFELTPAEAEQLSEFSVEPVNSELITAQMYKEEFILPNRNGKLRLDTFWTRTIKYEDFKESLTKFDYPLYSITAVTTNPTIFGKLGAGILNHVNKNELLSSVREKQSMSNADKEKLLVASIINLDSLRKAYNERLVKGEPVTPGGNQMTVLDGTTEPQTPELDLYDKMLELQEELKSSRRRTATENNIIAVFSPFSPLGEKVSFIDSVVYLGLYGFLLALGILILIALYKSLVTFESKHKSKKTK
jgi:hypothetical protein